jgi:class 3 adenylate cyclase
VEQQIRFCTTSDGVRIAYATLGEGTPLVFVRGWVSHLELDWELPSIRELYKAYAERFHVVRYDKRGTGLSDRDVEDFTPAARLCDLESLVDHLKLDRFAIVAISEGGPIAIAFAAAHPKRVSHLVLTGTYARGRALGKPDVQQALHGLVKAQWGLGSETLTNMFMPGASKEEHDWFTAYQRESASRSGAAAMLLANYAVDVSDLLPKISMPTLVMHAKGDRAIPFAQGREIASAIPNARFVPLESDRHAPDVATSNIMRDTTIQFILGAQTGTPSKPSGDAPLTILFTDITSSTSLTQQLGDAKAQELVRAHNAIVRDALGRHSGSEIKHTGDGIMASFGTASAALACAGAVQRALEAHNEQEPDSRVRVRIGLNAGEPVAEDGDLFGTAVQVAARICARAEPGQILAANVVRELSAGKQFLFADHGDVVLRGFEDPVHLFEVSWRA